MKIKLYNMAGEALRDIEAADAVFAQPANEAVVHQALVAQQANARQGTSDTKTRTEVAGSTKKLYRQKHTGRARAGSIKSGLRRGGGIIFGPHPRSYAQALPKKMRQLAIRCALSAKVTGNALTVVDKLKMKEPHTKDVAAMLQAFGDQKTALIALTGEKNETVIKSARNLPGVKTLPASQLNVADLLAYERLILTEQALREIETLWGGKS